MSPVVGDENFHLVINHDPIRKFQIPRAAELVQDISHHVEDNDPHNLALHDNDSSPTVSGDASGMLKYISAKFPNEVAELGENLNLEV